MNIIAIDCGASFLKGALFENGQLIKKSVRQAPVVNKDAWQSPIQINILMDMVSSMLRELMQKHTEITLCISNEMHGFILAEDNIPYTDYISWQKEFGNLPLEDGTTSLEILADKKYQEDILKTGMPLRAGLPSVNLLYLKHRLSRPAEGKKLKFFTLGDFILARLSGGDVTCHPTNAAATGLMNLDSGTWNDRLISLVAGGDVLFPVIGTSIMNFEFEGVHVRALPALGDQQAALLGVGLHSTSELSFNLGTGAQVSCLVENPAYSQKYQIRPYFYGKYLKTIPHLPSGRALNVYFRFLKEIIVNFKPGIDDSAIWQWILNSAKGSQGSAMNCDLSFFSNPLTDKKTGSIENIGEYDFNVGNLFKALFHTMAENFMVAARGIVRDNEQVQRIVFSGGIARKISLIREEILTNYRYDIEVSIGEDETLYGLAKYADEQS
ncbi:sedoheptulokinase [Anaerovibrio lipolyticus]|jgi:sugar (pentulose or hexulose) kinase|uniref:sedoheptulokinase n=1 Tax=Anaerovibrio lipolyticus TaxID=82374 RepID=UPI0026EEF5F5|nr:FGGY family carbohydrate kinase [Anaerovibrio lipolyticus]